MVGHYSRLGLTLGMFVAADQALKAGFAAMQWAFPSPLAGMFLIIAALTGREFVGDSLAQTAIQRVRPSGPTPHTCSRGVHQG